MHQDLFKNSETEWYYQQRKIPFTMWKVSLFGVTLVRIFPHSDWIRRVRSISPYSVEIRENADQNNSEYGNFLRSVFKKSQILSNMISNNIYNKSQHFDIDVNVQVDNENTKTKQIWRTPNIRKSQNIQTNSKEISSPSKLFHDTLFAYFRGTCVSKRFHKILIPKSIKVI